MPDVSDSPSAALRILRGIAATVPLWGFVTPAAAVTELDTVVVTGTRSEKTLIDTPVRTEVVSRETIEATHGRDVGEALRYLPGVLLRDVHGKSGKEIWLQGMDADRVLVLLDGRPVAASTGSTVDLSQLTTVNVDRIEVVKGAASSLYGSSAIGGVVNVITRSNGIADRAQIAIDTGSYGSKGLADSPSPDTRHINAQGTLRRNRLSLTTAMDIRDTDGFDLDPASTEYEGDAGTKADLTARLSRHGSNDSRTDIETGWYSEELYRSFSTFAPGVGDIEKLDTENARRFRIMGAHKGTLSSGADIDVYVMDELFEDETGQDVLDTEIVEQQRFAEIRTSKAEGTYRFDWRSDHSITLGLSALHARLAQTQQRAELTGIRAIDEIEPGAHFSAVELFLQDDIFLSEQWEIVPGIRYQNDTDFGSHLSPKISLMFVPEPSDTVDSRLRFSVSNGFRVPNLKERYYLFDHSANGYVVLGNSDLQPENSLNLQTSFSIDSANSLSGEVSAFYNIFQDIIVTSLSEEETQQQNVQVFRYSNVERAILWGVDARVGARLSPSLDIDLAYSWLRTRDRDTGLELTRRPRQKWQGGLTFHWNQRLDTGLHISWQDSEFVDSENTVVSPSFTTVDFKVNWEAAKAFTLFAGIDNVLDEHRDPDRPGTDFRPKEGRHTYAGLRYSFR